MVQFLYFLNPMFQASSHLRWPYSSVCVGGKPGRRVFSYGTALIFQFMSEKIGGAKGTELDDEFVEMERVSDRSVFDQILMIIHRYEGCSRNTRKSPITSFLLYEFYLNSRKKLH